MKPSRYNVKWAQEALENLRELVKPEAAQIVRKVARLEFGLHGNIKRLQDADYGFRLRMGRYRILFDLVGETILIQRIRHRKEACD